MTETVYSGEILMGEIRTLSLLGIKGLTEEKIQQLSGKISGL